MIELGLSAASLLDRFAWLVLALAAGGALATVARGHFLGRVNWRRAILLLIVPPASLGAIRGWAGERPDCALGSTTGDGSESPVPLACADAAALLPIFAAAVLFFTVAWGIATLATDLMRPRAEGHTRPHQPSTHNGRR